MSRIQSFMLIVVVTTMLSACNDTTENNNDNLNIAVTTTFLYDMVNILEDDVDGFDTSLIIPAGVDPHVYEPRASDLRKLNEADIILYHGLNFEGRMASILTEGISVTETFNTNTLEEMDEGDSVVVDPHFWFDLELYSQAFKQVKDILVENNPEDAEQYEENYKNYLKELEDLDTYVRERIDEIPENSRVLITPHDAFGYLASSYDIEVHAPQGFSTDSEVSNYDIQATADLIIERDVRAIFIETTTNPDRMKRLQEVVESMGGTVDIVSEGNELLSDSLAAVGENGDTFIDMFRHNIDIIVDHLK